MVYFFIYEHCVKYFLLLIYVADENLENLNSSFVSFDNYLIPCIFLLVFCLYRYMGIGLSSKTVSVSRLPGKIAVFCPLMSFDVSK